MQHALAHALEDADEPEQVVAEIPVQIGQTPAPGAGTVERDRLVERRDAGRREVGAGETGVPIGRQDPLHREICEIGQRVADGGEFPIQHGADLAARPGDEIVEPEIAVNDRDARLLGDRAGQPSDQPLDGGDLGRLGGTVLPDPAIDLPGEEVAGPAEIRETQGHVVETMQPRQRADGILVGGAPFGGSQVRQRAVPGDAALDQFHHVEGRADHARVGAERQRPRHGEARRMQRRDEPVFAIDRVGGRQQRAERLAPQHDSTAWRRDPIGRVGLTARELLDFDRSREAVELRREPAREGCRVDIGRGAQGAGPSPWRANSARAMARAWTSSGPSAKRSVRIWAQEAARWKSSETPPPP